MEEGTRPEKSTLWTDAGVDQNFQRDLGAIGPYEKFVWTTGGKGTPKNFCDKDFAELSCELSGAICLKTLALMGNDR